jgi:hypothetical protein
MSDVATVTPAAKRFVGTTNGAILHALSDVADNGNCLALRSEFSQNQNAANPFPTKSFLEHEGTENWYGVSAKWPTVAPYRGGWDSAGIIGFSTGPVSGGFYPMYGSMIRFDGGADGLSMYVLAGHYPSTIGSGQSDARGAPNCVNDWTAITPANCPAATNPNGVELHYNLLGSGGVRPLELGLWHDFIFHIYFKAQSNGILEIWHRVEGGAWEKLYSNVPGAGAIIQVAPHPTLNWNQSGGVPGVNNNGAGVDFQLYRGKARPTEHIYQSGIVRRQSEAAVRAVFP